MRVEIVEGEWAVLWVNVGHPIVTNGNVVAYFFSEVRGGDAALPITSGFFCFELIDVMRL